MHDGKYGGSAMAKMAASSTVGRVLSFCKQFQNVLRISSAKNSPQCTSTVIRSQTHLYR